ncbi:hypothetical protein JW921_02370 [Candidatus Fermentibacterales bacterium]|nr:hypothetical protein [Candidatus Fermentibacterales bacterium]
MKGRPSYPYGTSDPEPGAPNPSKPRETRPIMLTLLALLISVGLWIIAIGDREFVVEMRLPVRYAQPSPDLVFLEQPDPVDTVTVEFKGRGPAVLLDQYLRAPEAIEWRGELSSVRGRYPSSMEHAFEHSDLRFENGGLRALGATSFSPSIITRSVDRRSSRTVAVRALASGPIPGRFFWTHLSSDYVILHGAASVLDTIRFIETAPVAPAQPPIAVELRKPSGITGISLPEVEAQLVPPVSLVGLRVLD